MYLLLEFVVVDFVAVLALHFFAELFHHLQLCCALRFDSFVSGLDSLQHLCFTHFFHLAFHHHDIVEGGSYHQLDVGLFALFEGGVDYHFAVDAGYANLGDRTFKRDVGASQSSRGGQTCDALGHVHAVGTVHRYVDESLCMIITGEERTKGAVNQARNQNLVV